MADRPAAEIDITIDLVHQLLRHGAPSLADQPIAELSRGWDNTIFRLGSDLLVRVPHRAVAAPLIEHEQRWLPDIAARVDLSIPAPVHAGASTEFFPWPWSITPWFAGTEAARAELANPAATAEVLADFFNQLHTHAPADGPVNPYRGVPLADRTEAFEASLTRLDDSSDRGAITAVWQRALAAQPTARCCWLHGDLHGRNMIVRDGELTAVIDWGDITTGDPATDLAGAFMLVPDHLEIVRHNTDTTPADWERARGWALHFALIYLTMSDNDAVMRHFGQKVLKSALESA